MRAHRPSNSTDSRKSFRVRRPRDRRLRRARPRLRSPAHRGGDGGRSVVVLDRAGRTGRVHRTERRRQVDDAEDARRHPAARTRGEVRVLGPRAVAPAARARVSRSAPCSDSARSCGISCRRATRSSCSGASTKSPRRNIGAAHRRADGGVRARRAPRHAGPPAVARRADALRDRGEPAARAAACCFSTSRRSASTCRRRR